MASNIKEENARNAMLEKIREGNKNVDESLRFFDIIEKGYEPNKDRMPFAEYCLAIFDINNKNRQLKVANEAPNELKRYFEELEQKGKDTEKGFFKNFYDKQFTKFMFKASQEYAHYSIRHNLDKGARIDGRNSAMSSVASLLGCDNLLAKAEPMTLKRPTVRW